MSTEPTPTERATAIVGIAYDSGRYERARGIVVKYVRLEQTAIPRRALLVAVSGAVDRTTPAVKLADEWAEQRRSGTVVLSGPVGTGKTIAAAWYSCRRAGAWASAPMLGLAPPSKAHAMLEQLRMAPTLVLDEVGGQGTTSPMAVDRVATLLTQRHGDMRPTVVTTNLNRADFARLYDGVDSPAESRLLDRLAEGGAWLEVGGASRRPYAVDLARTRVDEARRLVALVDLLAGASSGLSVDAAEVDEAEAALGLAGTVHVAERVSATRASTTRVDSMVRELVDRLKVDDEVPL